MRLPLLLLLFALSASLTAQRTITGTVTSASDNESLLGVYILIKGTTSGTVTDLDGNYSITVPDGADVLVFSYTGFATQEVEIGVQSVIDVTLSEGTNLNEVIVVGYGEQKRGDITVALSNVSSDDLNASVVTSVDQALQGRAAGVTIMASSGQPGAAPRVNIRGATSVTASSDPLYVIDGVPMVTEDNSNLFTGGYQFSSISDINPNDIASIQVLKDASATAIYGSRGANGVILINTKRGASGEANIDFEVSTGWQAPTRVIDMMDSRQFIVMMNEAAANDGLPADWFSNPDNFNFIGNPDDPELQNTDWYGEILRNDAPISEYSLSARGGNENLRYFVSGGYLDQEGYQKGTGFTRMSARANLDASLNDKLTVGVTTFVSRSNAESTIGDNSLYGVMINALAADPTMPVLEDDGSYANPFNYYSWWAFENPRAATDLYERNTITNRYLGTVYGELELATNLKFRSSWSVDYQFLKDNLFYPSNTFQSIRGGISGEAQYSSAESLTWINENILTYNFLLGGRHSLDLLGGFTMQENTRDFVDINGQNFATDVLGGLELASDITDGGTFGTGWGLKSYLGRINYNFDEKYYVTLSARADGSSRFGENNRYGVFPSVALAWRLSGENFLATSSWLYDAKLRASYGISGNQEGISNFASRSLWSISGQFAGTPSSRPDQLGNSELGWESTSQLNLGLDLSVLDGRVNFTFDYFNKSTTDLLLRSIVPATSGYTTAFRNIGEVRNTGLEFSLNTVNLTTPGGFKWTTDFNISTIENEVVKLEQDEQVQGDGHILQEGEPLGSFFLIPFEGVDPQTGNSIFTDLNEDGIINNDDRAIPRDADGKNLSIWPDYFGGITNTFSYKGFSLSAFLQFSKGNYVNNHSRFAQEQVGWSFNYGGFFLPYGNNTQRVEDNRWRQPGDQTDIPRASLGYSFDSDGNVIEELPQNWQEYSTQWLEDASYLRLKTLQVSYDLPSALFEAIPLRSARVFFRGQNLFTATDYLGVDPEVNSRGGNSVLTPGEDFGGLGQAKSYVFGLKVGL
ncbi:TonB-dependent receptor [Neolewinella aurantiaca]|uniref:TonB-dependent receptor n=1 Tax=Neolewinella aurantiaca TaxID=2602767 RepID=A0A5C7FI62_9BACT|nr:TonB-dependent receptor [Neolewinella aurantiaca]TXF90922.1 TonB-dependent receptor [Neolewinella aurantiaca]